MLAVAYIEHGPRAVNMQGDVTASWQNLPTSDILLEIMESLLLALFNLLSCTLNAVSILEGSVFILIPPASVMLNS